MQSCKGRGARIEARTVGGDQVYFAVLGNKGFNRVLGHDTNTGETILNIVEEDVYPQFLQIRGDELWVTYNQESAIRVYNRISGDPPRTVETIDRVKMFDFIGDQLFYLTSYGKIVRLDLATGETKSTERRSLNNIMAVDATQELVYRIDEPSIIC